MQTSAIIHTSEAKRYLRMLCKHWSHKFDVTFDETQGLVPFNLETRLNLSATDEQLNVVLHSETATADELLQLQTVVAEHLQRFASKETLQFDWSTPN